MKRFRSIAWPLAFAGLMALGGVQGARIDVIQENEAFYRWLINAGNLIRLEGSLEFEDTARTAPSQDDEFFAEVADTAEGLLPDYPVDAKEDTDDAGRILPRIARAVRNKFDDDVWVLALNPAMEGLKAKFRDYRDANQLQSVGTQLSTATVYADENREVTGVGVTSMFLGFRKLAAGFLWFQVDKFWHGGQLHRMVPLMKTTVAFDPSFVDAYLLGAWHLAYNIPAKVAETPEPLKTYFPKYGKRLGLKEEWQYQGVEFLKDGIRKNPRDYRVYFDLGYGIFENKLNDHENAVRYLSAAREHRHDRFVPRMLFFSMMKNGQHEDAIAGWKEYLQAFPDNLAGPRFIRINEAYLAEARTDDGLECIAAARAAAERYRGSAAEARAKGDAEAAARFDASAAAAESDIAVLDAEVELSRADATLRWMEIGKNSEDPLAKSRLLRIQALEYRAEKRYYEAAGLLDEARYESPGDFFVEASNLIIEIKQEGNIPLSTSEKMAVEREKEAEQYRIAPPKKKIRRVPCAYIQDSAPDSPPPPA